jgi:hypothetical protein
MRRWCAAAVFAIVLVGLDRLLLGDRPWMQAAPPMDQGPPASAAGLLARRRSFEPVRPAWSAEGHAVAEQARLHGQGIGPSPWGS